MKSLSTQTRILPICGLVILRHWDNKLQIIHLRKALELRLNAVTHSNNMKVRQWKVGPNHMKSLNMLIWVCLKTTVDLLIKILMRTSLRPEKSRNAILC